MEGNIETTDREIIQPKKAPSNLWRAVFLGWLFIAVALGLTGYFLAESMFYIPGIVWIVVCSLLMAYRFYKWLDRSRK